MISIRFLSIALLPACLWSSSLAGATTSREASTSQAGGSVEIVGSIPHAGNAWAEGLLVSEGILWESTGLKGKSEVRGLDKQTGDVLWSVANPDGYLQRGDRAGRSARRTC